MSIIESQSVSIVAIGNFNPKIVHPQWLAANNLISKPDAEDANIRQSDNNVSIFTASFFAVQVLSPNRLQVTPLENGRDEEVRDLIAGILRILPHTPVSAIGINTTAKWSVPDEATWHEVGHKLAPKREIWSSVLESPGMTELSMQGQRPDEYKGNINVIVKPIQEENEYGIQTQINDHILVKESGESGKAEDAVAILNENWNKSLTRASKIVDKLKELPQ